MSDLGIEARLRPPQLAFDLAPPALPDNRDDVGDDPMVAPEMVGGDIEEADDARLEIEDEGFTLNLVGDEWFETPDAWVRKHHVLRSTIPP